MRGLIIGCVVALVLVCASTVMAADVSDQTLAAMGISSMEKMSDAQGMEVRGKSYAAGGSVAVTWLGWDFFAADLHVAEGSNVAVTGANALLVWPGGFMGASASGYAYAY